MSTRNDIQASGRPWFMLLGAALVTLALAVLPWLAFTPTEPWMVAVFLLTPLASLPLWHEAARSGKPQPVDPDEITPSTHSHLHHTLQGEQVRPGDQVWHWMPSDSERLWRQEATVISTDRNKVVVTTPGGEPIHLPWHAVRRPQVDEAR